jgi:hypothetical protein
VVVAGEFFSILNFSFVGFVEKMKESLYGDFLYKMFYGRSDLANKVVIEVFKNVSDFQINLTKKWCRRRG